MQLTRGAKWADNAAHPAVTRTFAAQRSCVPAPAPTIPQEMSIDVETEEARSQQYPLALVKVGEGRRAVDEHAVTEMMASIREVGLLNPITLNIDGTLIAGAHRLEAVRRLGWHSIPAMVRTLDDLHAELAEIDENLVSAPLTTLERGEQLQRRKGIHEALHPETRHVSERGGPGRGKKTGAESAPVLQTPSFTADVAAKTGMSERTVQTEVQIAENIVPDVKEMIRDTPLADQKTELLGIARKSADEQREIAESYREAIDANAFMATPGWKPQHVMEANAHLEAIPEPERPQAAKLVDQPGIPPKDAVAILGNLRQMPTEERTSVLSLVDSDDSRDRKKALTQAAQLPPMPDPRITRLDRAIEELRGAIRPFPNDPLTPRIKAVLDQAREIVAQIKGEAA